MPDIVKLEVKIAELLKCEALVIDDLASSGVYVHETHVARLVVESEAGMRNRVSHMPVLPAIKDQIRDSVS